MAHAIANSKVDIRGMRKSSRLAALHYARAQPPSQICSDFLKVWLSHYGLCPLYPQKRHWNSAARCPLCAKSGHLVLIQSPCRRLREGQAASSAQYLAIFAEVGSADELFCASLLLVICRLR